ncbi:MAG: helix-turn-helix transcriptional regulator [Chloroflexi bacterium]|nr:helix-turn-helix transcriptional regulator [Chloroflexota bacterium]
MKEASKYYPLYLYLSQSGQDELTLTVSDIEALLADPLPESAWTQRAWWSNRHSASAQAAAWLDAGYRLVNLDLTADRITFRRKNLVYTVRKQGDTILWDGALIKILREQLELSQMDLAKKLGMRQQTISEWENGLYAPRRSTAKFLTRIAEEAGFRYGEE